MKFKGGREMKVLIQKTRIGVSPVFILVNHEKTYVGARGQLTGSESEAMAFENVEAAYAHAKKLGWEAERPDTWWWLRVPLLFGVFTVTVYWLMGVLGPEVLPWRWDAAALLLVMSASLAPALKLMEYWGEQDRDVLVMVPILAWVIIFVGGTYFLFFVLRLPLPALKP